MAFLFKDKGLISKTMLFSRFVALAMEREKVEVFGFQCFV